MNGRRLRVGAAGLGRAFTLMLPTWLADPRVELVAGADPRPEAAQRFDSDVGGRAYGSVAELCADPSVEVVYIATPHQHHAAHAAMAAAHGKHALVEKPMALTLEDCRRMIDAAASANTHLIVGHSHSFDRPILRTREIVQSGAVGVVKMISAQNYTDYLYRPRRPEELATESGGGAIFSQAAHQVDIVRLLGGGQVVSVRALTGSWDNARPTEGAYAALLSFANGAFASLGYSGYAHFDSDEFCGGVSEMGALKEANQYGAARRNLRTAASPVAELALKNARNYGGDAAAKAAGGDAPWHQHFGLVVVSCERADLRPLPTGVMIYGDDTVRLDPLPKPLIPRAEVIDELYDAIVSNKPPLHDGRWAMATLEVCLAMLTSSRERREVTLQCQVPVTS